MSTKQVHQDHPLHRWMLLDLAYDSQQLVHHFVRHAFMQANISCLFFTKKLFSRGNFRLAFYNVELHLSRDNSETAKCSFLKFNWGNSESCVCSRDFSYSFPACIGQENWSCHLVQFSAVEYCGLWTLLFSILMRVPLLRRDRTSRVEDYSHQRILRG